MNRVMGRRYPFGDNPSFSNANASSSSNNNNNINNNNNSSIGPQPLDTQALLYVVYVLWTCLPSHIIANIAKHRWPKHVVEREPGLGGGYKGEIKSMIIVFLHKNKS